MVRRRKLIWQLFSSFLIVIMVALIAVTWFASSSFRHFHIKRTRSDLENIARMALPQIKQAVGSKDYAHLDSFCKDLRSQISNRITVILSDGRVVADSDYPVNSMENHSDRPELRSAFANGLGSSVRYSDTLNMDMLYVAIRIDEDGVPIGAIRTARLMTDIDQALHSIQIKIAVVWFLIALIAGFVILSISQRISRPLEDFNAKMRMILDEELGQIKSRRQNTTPNEIEELTLLMNQLALRLDERSGTILRQRYEEEAIFSSMSEAVLAVDRRGCIIKINQTSAILFNIDREHCRGKPFKELIHNLDLQDFLATTLSAEEHTITEIDLSQPRQVYLEAHGAPLRTTSGEALGAVVVLNDVTRLKRLENIRKDFVANVTHELRTPITSIQGFVETLLEGAIEEQQDAKHFLGIIARQSERLNIIIEDLLKLSKLEQGHDGTGLQLKRLPIEPVLILAIQSCSELASEKAMNLELDCDPSLEALIHESMLEQALTNLIQNAVKYSHAQTSVIIEAKKDSGRIAISVSDQGPGIAEEHHNRLFERFYRVDKNRSRVMGGTGLGLSIVKHIAQAHGGSVFLTSKIDVGSRFTIMLPDPTLGHENIESMIPVDAA